MKKFVILMSVLFLISACSGSKRMSDEEIQATISVGIEQTQLANPTSTYTNTPTDTPTYTPTFTSTPTFTNTPTVTLTPTITNTPTITLTPTVTDTPTPSLTPTRTNTLTPTKAPYQFTQTAYAKTQDYMAQFKQVDWRDFYTYPDKYKSDYVKLACRVFNVISEGQFQCWYPGTYEAFFVLSVEDFDDIYENDYLTVYGIGGGEYCGTNAFGGEVCSPIVVADFFVR